MGCCFLDLFHVALCIFLQFLSSFFSICFISIYVVHPYSRIDTTAAWKKLCFISLDRLDFYIINNLSIAVHTFARHKLISLSEDETLLLRYVNLFTNFREPPFRVEMFPFWLKHAFFFCLHSSGGQCLLLPISDYATGIWLELVYLQEALYHLHCLHP